MTSITTRVVTEDRWSEWRALRLAALAADPDAFGSTLADWSGQGDVGARWRGRLAAVRQQGAGRVALDVRPANTPAISLYRRHGFCDAGWATSPGDAEPERRMVLA